MWYSLVRVVVHYTGYIYIYIDVNVLVCAVCNQAASVRVRFNQNPKWMLNSLGNDLTT